MQRQNITANYIKYNSKKSTGTRLITVIDGQPFYQSTGTYSSMKAMWLPLVMFNTGSTCLSPQQKFPLNIPKYINPESLEKAFRTTKEGYIIKCERALIQSNIDVDALNKILLQSFSQSDSQNAMADRITRKEDLITSLRLRDEPKQTGNLTDLVIENPQLKLNAEEKNLIATPIKLAEKPDLSTDNPNEVNAWLLAQGAHDINYILSQNEVFFKALAIFANYPFKKMCDTLPNLDMLKFNDKNNKMIPAYKVAKKVYEDTCNAAIAMIENGFAFKKVMEDLNIIYQNTKDFIEAAKGKEGKIDDTAINQFYQKQFEILEEKASPEVSETPNFDM